MNEELFHVSYFSKDFFNKNRWCVHLLKNEKLYYGRLFITFYLCNAIADRCFFPLGNLFLVLWEILLYPLSLPSLFTCLSFLDVMRLRANTRILFTVDTIHQCVFGHRRWCREMNLNAINVIVCRIFLDPIFVNFSNDCSAPFIQYIVIRLQ